MRFVGKPPIYRSIEEMIPVLDEWYDSIDKDNPPTLTGLTLALGFADKKSVYDYQKKSEFVHSIKTALTIVENGYEKRLSGQNSTGSIFALKNFGWEDKQVNENTNINTEMTPEEREARIKLLQSKLNDK